MVDFLIFKIIQLLILMNTFYLLSLQTGRHRTSKPKPKSIYIYVCKYILNENVFLFDKRNRTFGVFFIGNHIWAYVAFQFSSAPTCEPGSNTVIQNVYV